MTLALTDGSALSWQSEVELSLPGGSLRRIMILSAITIVVGFGGVLGWAALARIDSAVPGTGVVVSGGKRKTVSLAESGILKELLVNEGGKVVAGQVLFRLDDTQIRSARAQANAIYWSAVARAARLTAEAADRRGLAFPPGLKEAAAGDPAVAAALTAEMAQFQTRWAALDTATEVQNRKIAQQHAHIDSLRAQVGATAVRLSLIQDELRDAEFLMVRGLSTRPHLLELRRTDADLRGQVGQLVAGLAEANQVIAQVEAEIASALDTRRSDIARETTETQAARADSGQKLAAAEDLLQKREITAPEAGTVTDIRAFTPGSSIQAGQPVMDLVPESSALLIEAKVAPNEVQHLAVGQTVNVRLTAYKAHRVPVIPGKLVYVGADRQQDTNNQPFFLVRTEISPDALKDKPGVVLMPGMSADVLIVNASRSVLDFLISPITDSMHGAMNEE
jgi:HlyD family secretion protein